MRSCACSGHGDRKTEYSTKRQEARLNPDRAVRTEVELWFHRAPQRREQAARDFRTLVTEAGGAIVHEALIPEIAYQGVLIDIPAAAIPDLVARRAVALAMADDVMFLRPQSVLGSHPELEATGEAPPMGEQLPTVGAHVRT